MTSDESHSYKAAARFLQTVIVVDDNAYAHLGAPPNTAASLGDESIDEAEGVDDSDFEYSDSESFETELIVEGFANLGMSCTVLAPKPQEDADDAKRLLKLATRADVVILDWVIRAGGGASTTGAKADRTTLSLLIDVLRQDVKLGGRARLICIYTGKADTAVVVGEVESALTESFKNIRVHDDRQRIDVGGVRIVLLRKHREIPIPGSETVAAAELPERVVQEFGQFAAEGLLPEIALESLSAIRDQVHNFLRRFDGSLDPALISHRSTTSPAIAEQFVLSLVGDELGAIVSAGGTVTALEDERVEAYVKKQLGDRSAILYWKNRATQSFSKLTFDEAVNALTKGIDNDMIRGSDKKLEPKISRSALLLDGDDPGAVRERAHKIDLQFSALSSLSRDRKFDGEDSPKPELRLGVLLCSTGSPGGGSDGECVVKPDYWLCMQPLCDSVRLTKPTQFPLLPLRRSRSEDKFDFVVSDEKGYIALEAAGLKLSEMVLRMFDPDAEVEMVVASWDDGFWRFKDQDDRMYTWLGDLRIDKAHKVLHSMVTVAGRIGIDEYEYYRHASTK